MAIAVSKNGSDVTITMEKNFDFNCVEDFRAAYEGVEAAPGIKFLIDMSATHYMDSSALGMLINMHKYWSQTSPFIRIVNTNDQIKKIFTISRFDKKFQID